jgi:hypothetical protein
VAECGVWTGEERGMGWGEQSRTLAYKYGSASWLRKGPGAVVRAVVHAVVRDQLRNGMHHVRNMRDRFLHLKTGLPGRFIQVCPLAFRHIKHWMKESQAFQSCQVSHSIPKYGLCTKSA